jgi:hypothetical protein
LLAAIYKSPGRTWSDVKNHLGTTWENYRLGAVSKPNLKFNITQNWNELGGRSR